MPRGKPVRSQTSDPAFALSSAIAGSAPAGEAPLDLGLRTPRRSGRLIDTTQARCGRSRQGNKALLASGTQAA